MDRSLIVAACGLVALTSDTHAQQLPKVAGSGGNLVLTGQEFNFNYINGQTVTLTSISNAISDVRSQSQTRVTGTCGANSAITGINNDGTVMCSTTIANILQQIANVTGQLPQPCVLSNWSSWSNCSAPCGGVSSRTRTIIQQATNAVACSAFSLAENRSCSAPCGSTTSSDPCNGNERWYNLNSGSNEINVASFVSNNDLLHYRRLPGATVAGTATVALQLNMTAGGIYPALTASGRGFAHGEYVCGSNGPISVTGRYNEHERQWVPTRMRGTQFVLPITRSNPQTIFAMALDEMATVSLFYGTVVVQKMVLQPGEVYMFANISRAGRNVFVTSTRPILATMAAGSTTLGSVPSNTGFGDWQVMVPAAQVIYGVPSTGYVSALLNQPTPNAARVNFACGGGQNQVGNVARERYLRSNYNARQYNGFVCRASSTGNILLGGSSVGDGDGNDAASWVPASLMGREFIMPFPFQHLTLACSAPGRVLIQNRFGQTAGQSLQTIRGNANGAFYYRGSGAGSGGLYLNSTAPCIVYADGVRNGDEIIIMPKL